MHETIVYTYDAVRLGCRCEGAVQRERHVVLERCDEKRSRREVACVEAADVGYLTAGVEGPGYDHAVILRAARMGGDEQGLAGIAARAEIVPRYCAGLEIDLCQLLLQAPGAVGGAAGDVGIALALAGICRVDAGELVGRAGVVGPALDLACPEVDAHPGWRTRAAAWPFRLPVVAQRLADREVVGIARQVEDQRAILLETVGEVALEEGVGLDEARLAASVPWHQQNQGRPRAVPGQRAIEA